VKFAVNNIYNTGINTPRYKDR